jgi:hypothetical protein
MRRALLVLLVLMGCTTSRQPKATQPTPAAVAMDESALMERLRQEVKSDPSSAVALADEGEKRFPNSSLREEREAMAIRAFINMQRIGSARGRAIRFLERYPSGPYTNEVAAMTGVHLTPKGPPTP